jgi:adenosylmethionine-8-amino-7-oxononanoate aminotransferase
MTHILHRSANAVMPVAVSGFGVEIVDAEGRRYLDASGGAAVLLAPPFIIEGSQVDAIVERLGQALATRR